MCKCAKWLRNVQMRFAQQMCNCANEVRLFGTFTWLRFNVGTVSAHSLTLVATICRFFLSPCPIFAQRIAQNALLLPYPTIPTPRSVKHIDRAAGLFANNPFAP